MMKIRAAMNLGARTGRHSTYGELHWSTAESLLRRKVGK